MGLLVRVRHTMKQRRPLLLLLVLLTGVGIQAAVRAVNTPEAMADDAPRAKSGKAAFEKEILPFLKKHCFACHGNGKSKAGLSFDRFKDDKSVFQDRKTWESVQHMLENREMPPESRPQPALEEVDTVLNSIRGLFHEFDRTAKPNVGRVTIRRLNRTEYNNTVRDLLGVDFHPADDFPQAKAKHNKILFVFVCHVKQNC